MRGRHAIFVAFTLLVAAGAGVAVGAAAQLAAVDAGDPRTGPIATVPPTPELPSTPEPSPTAMPATPTVSPSPSPESADVWLYTLVDGDSLSAVAIRYGTTTEDLLILNPEYAANQNLVEVGAQLIVPCTPLARAEDRC
jgi:LysM repeat protein